MITLCIINMHIVSILPAGGTGTGNGDTGDNFDTGNTGESPDIGASTL